MKGQLGASEYYHASFSYTPTASDEERFVDVPDQGRPALISSAQRPPAAQMHGMLLASGERTCIACPNGIAHKLPDMTGVPGWNVSTAN